MYNEERKKHYIKLAGQYNMNIEQPLTSLFGEIERFEENEGKDICDFTLPEIMNYYKSRVSRSLETLLAIHSMLNGYARYCLGNCMIRDNQNHFEEIDREILNMCVNTAYLRLAPTREQLLKVIRKFLNPYEQFLALAIFEGIGGQELSDFRNLSMNDFNGNTVSLPGRTLTVSDELVRLAVESAGTYEYETYGDNGRVFRFDPKDKRIIKDKPGSSTESIKGFRHRISTNLKRLNELREAPQPIISRAMLFEGGRIEMIKDFMKKDGTNAKDAIIRHKKEIAERYSNIQAISRYLDKWKELFPEENE